MALNFPNLCRSFEGAHNRVRFWGYDSAIEITFFVPLEALKAFCPDAKPAEESMLAAFDAALDRIHQAACNAYGRHRDLSYAYVLSASDF